MKLALLKTNRMDDISMLSFRYLEMAPSKRTFDVKKNTRTFNLKIKLMQGNLDFIHVCTLN